ncbi:hypothetical protein BDM02DRAFT_3185043 [Thelephora ganbajun]|uniref:Uncharacterized protein n=1 Tax=Thelephora ganbajun TaxID=370292 RepID=A0ACB6ZNH5_THEGA|nr:hypothetical protein BDM02DRAFT_3185043 [Thelephora ganbajun]
MSSSPLLLLADTQADILGSSFPPSSLCLQSPQLSQISPLIGQSPEVDSLWHEIFLGANTFLSNPDLGPVPPCFLDSEIVDHLSIYDSYAPSTIELSSPHYLTISEIDDGSTPSLSASPVVLTPIIWSTCICGCGGGPCIRQRPYRRPKGDTLEDHRIGELITFKVHGQCGMPLRNALRGIYSGLSGRDDPMFVGSRTSISIRLEWPDCAPWAKQMRTKDWRRKPSPITKAKLSTEVAKKVDRFLKELHRNPRNSQRSSPSPGPVDINSLALVALEHVSMASWQPHLRLI